MLFLASYDIVFSEVPGETTLALNLSACPNRCPGCHSVHLQQEEGEVLDDRLLSGLLDRYGRSVTCVGFMGGDGDPAEVDRLARKVRGWRASSVESTRLKTAWYSGRQKLADKITPENFDFIKLGPYIDALGPLTAPSSNQKFYRVENGSLVDATELFRRN